MRSIDADALYAEMAKQKAFGMLTAEGALRAVANAPTIEPERKKPEQQESAKEYCNDCIHCEMCSWYPVEGCEFKDNDHVQYVRGYNDAKREIALSGEYERAYQRGKEDALKGVSHE